jgi:hypothetical protein
VRKLERDREKECEMREERIMISGKDINLEYENLEKFNLELILILVGCESGWCLMILGDAMS